jgi:hypothetical protein
MPITYTDKVQLTPNANPIVNQWRAVDANEVKNVVNALVVDAINDGVIDTAPSQNAVFDALALKANLTDLNITLVSITGAISLTSTAFGKFHVCTGTTIDYTVDLPTAVGNSGGSVAIKGAAALTVAVTIAGVSGQLIDGESSRKISSDGLLVMVSDGTDWIIINEVGSWIPFTTTPGGFSVNPTYTRTDYFRVGKICTARFLVAASGTSSATTTTLTIPFTSAEVSSVVVGPIVNGGAVATTPGIVRTRSASATIDCFRNTDAGTTLWTASNTKNHGSFSITFRIA